MKITIDYGVEKRPDTRYRWFVKFGQSQAEGVAAAEGLAKSQLLRYLEDTLYQELWEGKNGKPESN